MVGRIQNILAILSVSTLLALGGVAGVLYGQGRLNRERLGRIAAVLREDSAAPQVSPPSVVPPASQPASPEPQRAVQSAEEIRQQRRDERLRRAALERAAQDLLAQKRLVDQALQELITREEAFAREQAAWVAQQRKLQEKMTDEGFRREVEYVSKLSPKQAKEHVLRAWAKNPADAVRLFNALKVTTGQQILAQFKSAEELNILHELLEQIRQQDVDRLLSGSGTTPGG